MPRDFSIKSVLVIGSGPIVIGQACEFDYSGTQACRVLRSEVGESAACGVSSPQQTVDESNQLFARVLGEALINRMPYSEAYEYVDTKYGMLADLNDVARYNLERWYCRMDERMDYRTGKLGSHTWPGRQLELALLGSRELSSYI